MAKARRLVKVKSIRTLTADIAAASDERDKATVKVYVMPLPDRVDLLLGLDWMCKCGCITNTRTNTVELWHTTIPCQLQEEELFEGYA